MADNIVFQRLVLDYISSNKGILFLYVVVIIFTWPTEAILLSRQYSSLVTSLNSKVPIEKIFDVFSNISSNNIFGVLSLILFTWVMLIIFYRIKYSMEQKLFPNYMTYIRTLLVSGIMKSNSNNYKDIKSGEYISMINELTHVLLGMVEKIANKFLPLMIGMICIAIYYSFIHPVIGACFIGLNILRILFSIWKGFDYSKSCAIRDKAYFKLNEHFNDTFNNSMNIHLNNTMKHEEKNNKNITDSYDKDQEEEMRIRKEILWKANLMTVICFITIIVVSYTLYVRKKIPLALLITIAFIEIKLVGTFIDYDNTSLSFFQKLGTVIATDKFLKNILHESNESNKKCKTKDGSIEINNMSFKYDGKGPNVINQMNVHIQSGEHIGIIGRSGSGKTTLMKILTGLHQPTGGNIKIGNCNIGKINNEHLRSKLTYINQKTSLFNETVADNIKYGNPNLTTNQINDYLNKYDLTSIYTGLKNGINTNVGVNGSILSLGMQKVTMILRGIFKENDIIILDEPLTGLDDKTKAKIIKIIDSIPRTKTIIVVTHDDEILSHLDKVYKLHELQASK